MSKPTFDKFGHYRGLKAKAGPPGKGFVLDEKGNYDMQEKILTNLHDPESDQDAVTKSHLKRKLDTCLQFDATKRGFNCRRARLFDLMRPEGDNDAVTLSLLKEKTINNLGDGMFDGKKMRLKNVADPQNDVDAVNLGYLKYKGLCFVEKEGYDAKGRRIKDLADPQADKDGVNLNFLRTNTLNCKESAEFDGQNKRIQNVASPVENQDCVNLSFLKEKTLNSLDGEINAGLKKIVDLSEGMGKNDAVSVGQLMRWIKFSGIIMERELADAMIEIRREIHHLRKQKHTKAEIESRLNSQEVAVDRDWRTALHAAARKDMTEAEFAQFEKIGINKDALRLFSTIKK